MTKCKSIALVTGVSAIISSIVTCKMVNRVKRERALYELENTLNLNDVTHTSKTQCEESTKS